MRVSLGKTVITSGAINALSASDVASALARHASGDWGAVGEEDWRLNDEAYREGSRLLSSYTSALGTKFWIITESDRSITTVLLPEEY